MAHNYQIVREWLMPWQIARIISRIDQSKQFEMGELSHVYIRGTETRVGYLGDETAELVDTNKRETKPYRRELRILFNAV